MAIYATPAEVRPLLGNLGNQRTDAQIQLSIDSATDEINRKTNRIPPNDWQTTDADFDVIKKLARYHAALEMSIGIKDFEDRDMINKEIRRLYEMLIEFSTDPDTDFTESSAPETWSMSSTGIIWSVRYPKLKKMSTTDNSMYSDIHDIGGG